MKALYLFVSYGSVFTLGLYTASQFRFDEPVAVYRWAIAFFLLSLFGILSET